MKPCETEEIVLEGVLIPAGWGPSGEVLNVGLMTFEEDEYRVDSAVARDHGLLDHLRSHVRLSAVVFDGRVIGVRRVEVLGSRGEWAPFGGPDGGE